MGLQIAQIYGPTCTSKGGLSIRKVSVQQQEVGTLDCGLFAVAYATEVCYGMDPAKASFEQSKMNIHLVQCLEAGNLARFPQTSKVTKGLRPPSIVLHLELYCYCNMPESYEDMIECESCKKWYHKTCAGINGLTRRQVQRLAWLCKSCTGESNPSPPTCTSSKPEEFLPKYSAKKHSKYKKVAAGNVLSILHPPFVQAPKGRYAFGRVLKTQASLKMLTLKKEQQVKEMEGIPQDEQTMRAKKTKLRNLQCKCYTIMPIKCYNSRRYILDRSFYNVSLNSLPC